MENLHLNKELFTAVTAQDDASLCSYTPPQRYSQLIWKKFVANKTTLAICVLLLLIFLYALIGPMIRPYAYDQQDYNAVRQTPNSEHWFGTDQLGRDLFVRVAHGTRISLMIALSAALLNILVGSLYGAVSGYYGGKVDMIMYRAYEILNSIPAILWVLLLATIFKPGISAIIIVLALTGWTYCAQMVRARVLEIKQMEYVQCSKTMGAKPGRVILRHLIPNSIGIIIVQMALSVPNAIFTEAMISYIGMGVQPPAASLGTLLSEAGKYIRVTPYQLLFPALFIFLVTFCFNILGDALRDAVDPQIYD